MKITVHAHPLASEEKIEKITENEYRVYVKKPPVQGRANKAIVKLLAQYFSVELSDVRIVIGYTSRHKIIEITKLDP